MKRKIKIHFSEGEPIITWSDYEKLIKRLRDEIVSDWIRFNNQEHNQDIIIRKDKIRIIELLLEND